MKKKLLLAVVVVVVLLAGYVVYILSIAGELRELEPHFAGECALIEGPVGPEDFALKADGSGMFISSQDRRAHLTGAPTRGAIFYLDLQDPKAVPVNVTPNAGADFRPHGIGLWEGDESRLFVVNHPAGNLHGDVDSDGPAHTIEVYDLDGDQLRHVRTIADPLLITPNDVAPVGPDAFYATNDHGSGQKWVRKAEDYLRIGRSHIVFYDGTAFRRNDEVGSYKYANGIIASRDRKSVFMLATTDRALFVYDRDTATNALTLSRTVDLGTGPDNLTFDADGDLWIGSHPKMLTLAGHLSSGEGLSPSQILRIDADTFDVEEVFLSDGSDISASTVGVRAGNRLFIGSIFDPGILACSLPKP